MYDNPQHAVSLDPTQNFVLNGQMPYISSTAIANYLYLLSTDSGYSSFKKNYFGYDRPSCSVKLLEYLGYGNFENFISKSWADSPLMVSLNCNIFGLLAYQKIYADYYRDGQWERISPSSFNVDYLDGTSMNITDYISSKFYENYNFLTSVIVIGRKTCFMVFFLASNMVMFLLFLCLFRMRLKVL